ncbi:MAG TPA: YncE family protein [Casimicrobium huifangae]|nr:YncE family protein [Casimicrobium huifangae]
MTASPNQQRVYVSNHAANTVSVIRTADRAVIATVNVGSRPMGVAISPTQPRAYVANFGGNTVTVFDTGNHAVLASVNVGNNPSGLAITPTGDRLFVANSGDSTISVVDTASNVVTTTITAVQSRPYALAYLANGASSRLLVANNNSASVSVLDGTSYATIATTLVGAHPTAIGIVDASKAYVLNHFDGNFSVINPTTGAVIGGAVTLPAGAVSLAVAPDSSFASVTAYPNSLARINTTINAVTIPVTIPNSAKAPLTFGAFVMNPAYECALDVNNDNAYDLQDATLILRYLAGLRGAALVNGVSGPGLASAEAQLAALNLDADGDGARIATTDGMLLERAAVGMIGAPLISNARNTSFPGVRSATLILQWILDTHGANCLP